MATGRRPSRSAGSVQEQAQARRCCTTRTAIAASIIKTGRAIRHAYRPATVEARRTIRQKRGLGAVETYRAIRQTHCAVAAETHRAIWHAHYVDTAETHRAIRHAHCVGAVEAHRAIWQARCVGAVETHRAVWQARCGTTVETERAVRPAHCVAAVETCRDRPARCTATEATAAMIIHVVLFRLRPDLADDARDALAAALARATREIPSIRHARVGSRVTLGRAYEQLMTTDYSFAAILEFEDRNGLQTYLDHPAHEQLAQRFYASVGAALTYDFEMWESDEGIERIRGRV